MDSSSLNDNELIFTKSDGKIQSAGFTVDSILLQKGQSPLITQNSAAHIGGSRSEGVANIFKDLAVPAGLTYFVNKHAGGGHSKTINNDEIIGNDLHEMLLKFVEVGATLRAKKTRRASLSKKTNTKKHRT